MQGPFPPRLERRIQAFEQDRESGAAQLARKTVEILQAVRNRDTDPATFDRLRRRLARAHPAMAAVWNAAHAPSPEHFLTVMDTAWRRAARHARELLPPSGMVVTLSYSSTVIETLGGRGNHVVVGLSLPGGEGARAAEALRQRGTEAYVVADAALASWVAAAEAVVIGADAVTRRGIVNKVGSRLLALAARAERCPCYVIADTTKFPRPPSPFPLPLLGPGALFEYTELALITRIVTEDGALTPRVVGRRLRAG